MKIQITGLNAQIIAVFFTIGMATTSFLLAWGASKLAEYILNRFKM